MMTTNTKLPSLTMIYLRAVIGAITKPHSLLGGSSHLTLPTCQLKRIPKETLQFTIDPNHVQKFLNVINHPNSNHHPNSTINNNNDGSFLLLPISYLQCLLNSMPMNILTHSEFPLNIIGSVHESMTLQCYYKKSCLPTIIPSSLSFQAHCRIEPKIQLSDKNDWIFTIVTEILEEDYDDTTTDSSPQKHFKKREQHENNNTIMTITNQYRILNPDRNKKKKKVIQPPLQKKEDEEEVVEQPVVVDYFNTEEWDHVSTWDYPLDTGFKYATLNGDINPIHIHPVTAQLFGYKSCIAHGMYSVCKLLEGGEGTTMMKKMKKEEQQQVTTTTSSTTSNRNSNGMTTMTTTTATHPTTITARFTRPTFLPNQSIMTFFKKGTNEYVIGTPVKTTTTTVMEDDDDDDNDDDDTNNTKKKKKIKKNHFVLKETVKGTISF